MSKQANGRASGPVCVSPLLIRLTVGCGARIGNVVGRGGAFSRSIGSGRGVNEIDGGVGGGSTGIGDGGRGLGRGGGDGRSRLLRLLLLLVLSGRRG